MESLESVVKRLEAVANKLEKLQGSDSTTAVDSSAESVAPSVADFDTVLGAIDSFVGVAEKIDKDFAAQVETASTLGFCFV
jgi:hypothetical protein